MGAPSSLQAVGVSDPPHFTPRALALRVLAQRFPTFDAAVAEILTSKPS